MPKRTVQQEERRLWNSGQADINEHERIVTQIAKNKELQDELVNLRKRYKIAFKNILEQVQWFESQPIETLAGFSNDVKAIVEKHCISERMNNELWSAVWSLPKSGYEVTAALGSMPKIHWSKELGVVLLITPETDITNKLVINFIKEWQRAVINNSNVPPQPQKIKGSKGLDRWRPVWEWSLRHPQITRKEIAQMLHRDYTEVKRQLKQLDNEIGNLPLLYFQK